MFIFDSTFNSADLTLLVALGVMAVVGWLRFRRSPAPEPVERVNFNLADDLADQRRARVIRQATAYRENIDRRAA